MKIISKFMSTQSILTKLVAVFLLLIIVPVSVIGYISTSTASNSLTLKTEENIAASTMQTSSYFDLILKKAEDISLQVLANDMVQKHALDLTSTSIHSKDIDAGRTANNFVTSLVVADKSFSSISILLDNGSIIGSLPTVPDLNKVKSSAWYRKVIENQGRAVWINEHNEGMQGTTSLTYAVSLAREFKAKDTASSLGVMLVDVKYDVFADILSKIHLGENDSTYLISGEGKVLTANGMKEDGKIMERAFIKKVLEDSKTKNRDLFYVDDNGTNYLASYFKSETSNWTALTIIPKSEIIAGSALIRNRTILAGLIFAVLAMIIGFVFSLKMTADMKFIMNAMERAENGDLTVSLKLKRKDEIGKLSNSFNSMISQIKNLVIQSKDAAIQVGAYSESVTTISRESAKASSDIAKTIEEVASGASDQAAEVESSVKSVSLLATKINHAVEGTNIMGSASDDVKKLASNGIETIETLNKKASETNKITSSVVSEIGQLNEYVKNIDKITEVLKGIADQTNLLALNAAIEAARAGDAGKGFAVVADEVRKLAEQSNNFTKEIQNFVEKILKQSESSTYLVNKAEITIKEQGNLVEETAVVFSNINNSTGILAENITKMADIVSDMNKYKEQVMSSIQGMAAISEETAASTEEVSASTEEQLASIEELDEMAQSLNGLAHKLISEMEKFKI